MFKCYTGSMAKTRTNPINCQRNFPTSSIYLKWSVVICYRVMIPIFLLIISDMIVLRRLRFISIKAIKKSILQSEAFPAIYYEKKILNKLENQILSYLLLSKSFFLQKKSFSNRISSALNSSLYTDKHFMVPGLEISSYQINKCNVMSILNWRQVC